MRAHTLLALAVVAALSACSQGGQTDAEAKAVVSAPLLVAQEDLLTTSAGQLAMGSTITGALQPAQRADLRAEISAVVMQVLKDNGDRVNKGDLLVRLDDTAIRESLNSAREAERAAEQAFDQSSRQLQRLTTLSGTGAVSTQALEDAEIRRNSSQSELAGARTRVVQARQQLERTEVRAPFTGVVSERNVNAGDTAQVGKQLVLVIDPASMRFEGFVPTEQVAFIKVGNPVNFRVNGYANTEFSGSVQRINPIASVSTRQVEVHVQIDKTATPLVAGLFAEGRVKTKARDTLVVPESTLVREGDNVYVWRVHDKVLNKVAIKLGERDIRRGDYEVTGGIQTGEQILRHPQGALKDGAKIEMRSNAIAGTATPTVAGE